MHGFGFRIGVLLYALALTVLGFGLAAEAQGSWSSLYSGSAMEAFNGAVATADGGYIACGWTYSSGAGSYDGLLIRTGPSGNVLWQRTYGGPGGDGISKIFPLEDGGYLAVGYTDSFGAGQQDAWVLRLDGAGSILWQRTYGGPGDDWGGLCTPAGDGGFVLAGYTEPSGGGQEQQDVWVFKIDADGHVVWQKTFGSSAGECANDILRMGDGFLIPGQSWVNQDSYFGWLIKLDASGSVLWQRRYDGGSFDFTLNGVTPLATGGFVGIGVTYEGGGSSNGWVGRLDDSGAFVWQKTLRTEKADYFYDAVGMPDGGCVLAGFNYPYPSEPNNADVWAVKVDGSGNLLWQGNFGQGGWDITDNVSLTNDGGVLAAGRLAIGGTPHAWLIKTPADGAIDSSCTFAAMAAATFGTASVTVSDLNLATADGIVLEGNTSIVAADSSIPRVYLCASAGACTVSCTVSAPHSAAPTAQAAFSAKAAPQNCTGLATFAWDFGDGGTSTLPTPTHTYATAGQYTWTLTATSDGVSSTKTGTIAVVNPPVVTSMTKAGSPFRILVRGSNLQSGMRVYIGDTEWTNVARTSDSLLKMKGGASLKAAVPKGASKSFRFVNPDGGEITQPWGW